MCFTEHETVISEPASTSGGTSVITGFSGEAEHIKLKELVCQLKSRLVNGLAEELEVIPDLS